MILFIIIVSRSKVTGLIEISKTRTGDKESKWGRTRLSWRTGSSRKPPLVIPPHTQSGLLLLEGCDAFTCPKVCIYKTALKVFFLLLKDSRKVLQVKKRNNMLGVFASLHQLTVYSDFLAGRPKWWSNKEIGASQQLCPITVHVVWLQLTVVSFDWCGAHQFTLCTCECCPKGGYGGYFFFSLIICLKKVLGAGKF